MSIFQLLAAVALAGVIGGLVNALTSDNGFILPKKEQIDKLTILRPGYLGNAFMGAVAATISWGLYGPLATYYVLGGVKDPAASPAGLTLSALFGAVLVGVGGAKWLTNEVDKSLLRAAASKAASSRPVNDAVAQQMALASPAQALQLAREMTPR